MREDNFATVPIDWRDGDAYVELAIRSVDGKVLQKLDARFEEAGRAAAAKSAR